MRKALPTPTASGEHVLSRLAQTPVGSDPFRHLFITDVLPPDVYAALQSHMLRTKRRRATTDRRQDNPEFVNRRHSLYASRESIALHVREVFASREVKTAVLGKFYGDPSPALVDSLAIHEEFEFVFTSPNRFQNIHIDIPPKYLSFVFYIPDGDVGIEDAAHNGTVLYDRGLTPHHPTRFLPNSVCVFAPHFHSYHGFSSTIERDAMVMFYVNPGDLTLWRQLPDAVKHQPPYPGLLDTIERKLTTHPLLEYENTSLVQERQACRVNAPQGRVLI